MQISLRLYPGRNGSHGYSRVLYGIYRKWSKDGVLVFDFYLAGTLGYLYGCGKWHRKGVHLYDADSGDTGHSAFHLRHHQKGSLCRSKILLSPQYQELLLDDGGVRHGTDVLFPLHCYGNPDYLRFLYEVRPFYRRIHQSRGDF